MFKTTLTAALIAAGVLGLSACDVKKTQEGNITVPKYEVQKKAEGFYVLMVFHCLPTAAKELERRLRVSDLVMKHIRDDGDFQDPESTFSPSEIDDDEAAFASGEIGAAFDIPAAFGELERRLLLAQMIAAWAKGIKPDGPAQAPLVVGGAASTLALADDLARLTDDMVTRKVEWSAFDGLVPDAVIAQSRVTRSLV